LAADLLREFEPEIERITLIPSEGGRFEVVVNDDLIYSKKSTGRHPHAGEVVDLIRKHLKERTK